ncbi:hypothetical protein E4U32_000280 [Claviceps aff. humidiphila group G2b]|nr:hypothetical protein E4U32_000280 [Claviceps aff. humidiphila group G2b]
MICSARCVQLKKAAAEDAAALNSASLSDFAVPEDSAVIDPCPPRLCIPPPTLQSSKTLQSPVAIELVVSDLQKEPPHANYMLQFQFSGR